MTLNALIKRRQRALFEAWVRNPLVQVQVEHPEYLGRLVFLGDFDDTVETAQAGRRSLKNVAIVNKPGNPDVNTSVWVRAGYSSYQKAWLGFVEQVYGIKATANDLAGYNIDHLLNKARSPDKAGFIRIEAINDAVNQDWGRLFERAASNPDFSANQKRFRRTMSWIIAAKLMEQSPPRGPGDHDGIARLVQFFNRNGLAADNPQRGLTEMLEFAYRFQ
ncbi:hypothetical protein [Roseibium salinum]|uniref:Uncharacterized protein n=1 Tax=Roseibium salinum TaxID=1604349 RepID=A0ABT3R034_9HYPH|nr:hypothetical protein [Roseibium sp. DSM 29163]MCX2722519.1 hypothetical protein [Roseibium sp. DSM 29163]